MSPTILLMARHSDYQIVGNDRPVNEAVLPAKTGVIRPNNFQWKNQKHNRKMIDFH